MCKLRLHFIFDIIQNQAAGEIKFDNYIHIKYNFVGTYTLPTSILSTFLNIHSEILIEKLWLRSDRCM